ncbi:hypothetical protein D3C87_1604860 [compost metagenome]
MNGVECRRERHGEFQEAPRIHRCAERTLQGLTLEVLEDQDRNRRRWFELERSQGPGGGKPVGQLHLMRESLNRQRRQEIGFGNLQQHRGSVLPRAIQDDIPVLAQGLRDEVAGKS